jgi:hypothetical protein
VVSLLLLSCAERVVGPETTKLDGLVDAVILITAGVGACASWVLSYRLPLRKAKWVRTGMVLRIAAGWFVGPLLGVCAAVAPAHDIDGGLLLFYPPVVGFLLALFILPIVVYLHKRRLTNRSTGVAVERRI